MNARDRHSRTPLHLAAWAGHTEAVTALIAQGAQTGLAAMADQNALHFAAQKGHLEVCRELLNAGMNINAKNRKGMNALHIAAQNGAFWYSCCKDIALPLHVLVLASPKLSVHV